MKDPKNEKKKPQKDSQEDGRPICLLFQTAEKKYFSKEELVSSNLEETADSGIFPRGRNLSPKRNQLVTLKSQETRGSPI